MDFESRRQRILDKMEDNSIAILYSGIEHHVSADEYDLFTAQANPGKSNLRNCRFKWHKAFLHY